MAQASAVKWESGPPLAVGLLRPLNRTAGDSAGAGVLLGVLGWWVWWTGGCGDSECGKRRKVGDSLVHDETSKGGTKPTKEGFECKRRKEWALSLCLRTDQDALRPALL